IHKCWGSLTAKCRRFTACITGREIEWLKMSKIILFNHTLHKDGTDHPAPTDQTYFHVTLPRCVKKSKGIRVYQKGTQLQELHNQNINILERNICFMIHTKLITSFFF